MGLTVLGISGGHDANWCVWQDGKILGAFEKERFTRRRHDTGAVESLIGPSLRYLGLEAADIDVLATSEPVALGQTPGHTVIAGRRYERLNDWQWQVARCLGRVIPCLSVPHHVAHAAYARYTSPFAETAVLTLDGGGDWYTVDAKASTTVSSWAGSKLEWIERIDNSDFGSLWFGYSDAIFRDSNAAGKLMGLAAFGTDRLVEAMRDRMLAPVRSVLSGAITVKDCWPDFDRPPFLPADSDWQRQEAKDAAFAVQQVTTEAGLSLAAAVRAVTGRDRLALAGGVALNGYLTTAIARKAGFASTFVPPAVNDGGIAVGAALFAAYHELGWEFDSQASSDLAFLGMEYPPEQACSALREAGFDGKPTDVGEAAAAAAEVLSRGGIVAWYEGRSEHGPRALGNRSILSSPLDDAFRQRLNSTVKFRESFRPVAPAVLAGEASRYFDLDWPSPFMMHIVNARASTRDSAPAVVHCDGTARVQTVAVGSSLGQIITAFARLTGMPIVVNTSLNVRTPIVETPAQAVEVFCRVPIDMAYVSGYLVAR
ncbi:MAG TPA: carbamoyltransferase C-terminal domain-containing protein [Streptosporangiaceae bacterium]|nr:carbamoyltransferase C-terminal domain-containing protein [Streptosporangiaceae bacterium]